MIRKFDNQNENGIAAIACLWSAKTTLIDHFLCVNSLVINVLQTGANKSYWGG